MKIVCKLVPVPAEGEATTDALAEELQYVAHIDLNEVPEDTEMRTEITANLVGADGEPRDDVLNAVALNLKVCSPVQH